MKRNKIISSLSFYAFILLSSLFIISCNDDQLSGEDEDVVKTEDLAIENYVSAEIKVNGMTNEACEKAIENSIYKLSGINHAKISRQDSLAIVEFDQTQTNEEAIKEAIRNAGYKVVE